MEAILAHDVHAVVSEAARFSSLPVPRELMIGLRVMAMLSLLVVVHAQWRAWRGKTTPCRVMIIAANLLLALVFLMAALVTSKGGDNIKLYQVILLAAVMTRALADAITAGQTRFTRRKREGRCA